jgi:cytochrome c oxidase subunit 2
MASKLIFIIVIVLGVVALAQLVRMYELSSKLRGRGEHEINSRDNNLNGKLMIAFMAFQFLGFIWLMLKFGWTGRGDAASVHGEGYDWLLNLNFIVIIAVFFITNFLLFYFAFKYVRKPGVKAFFFPHDNKLEMIWTVVPAIVLLGIIILGLKSWNDITDHAEGSSIRVELFSKQFDWTARYSGEDNKLGKFDYKLTTDANELGLMTAATIDTAINTMKNGLSGIHALETDLNNQYMILPPDEREAKEVDLSRKQRLIRLLEQMKENHDVKVDAMAYDDYIQKDTLYLCLGQEYEFNFRAKDVIHSAYFPHFRAQMNTVPGQTTRFKFTPSITTTEMRKRMDNPKFHYILMCNKICGGAHYKMKMIVVVLPKNEYTAWTQKKMATDTFKSKFLTAPAVAEEAEVVEVAVAQ